MLKKPAFPFILALALAMAACFGIPIEHNEKPPASTPGPAALSSAVATPASGAPVILRFAVKGDWGKGTAAQAAVTALMCRVRAIAPFDIVVSTGDNFYGPDGKATNANYYNPERCLYSYPGHQWRAAWGNHDYGGDDTADVLGAPESPRYYTWTAADAAFFVYDGTRVTSEQKQWLREEVCGSSARVKVIYGHQPAYSVGAHGSSSDVRSMVEPVARECGVALVIAGHDHLYERSRPIDGVTYVVSGGGGSLYDCKSKPAWLALCLSRAHFLLAEVTPSSIRVTAIGLDGGVLDRFEVPLPGGH